MSLSRKEIQAIVYRAVLDLAEGGIDRVRDKIKEFEGQQGEIQFPVATGRELDREPLSDAVVTAVIKADRFIDARAVLDLVRDNSVVAQEPDERLKRRKVSLALYGQKNKGLRSVKTDEGKFVWGLPEWWDAGAERFHVDREPLDDDGITHDAVDIDPGDAND